MSRPIASMKDVLGWINTRNEPDGTVIPGIGVIDHGVLETTHVTDNPEGVLRAIRRKQNVIASYGRKGQYAELGPGLYFSGVPEFWTGRARAKWGFLSNLTRADVHVLTGALDRSVSDMVWENRITTSEANYARNTIFGVLRDELLPTALVALAGQPYNIAFWRESYLSPLGIEAGAPPRIVTVWIRGVLAEVCCDNLPAATYRTLRRLGAVGAYKRPGMTVNPELVLWDTRAIVDARVRSMRRG